MYIISLIYIIELSHKKQRYAIIHLPVQKKTHVFLYKKCRHTLLWRFVFVLSLFLNDVHLMNAGPDGGTQGGRTGFPRYAAGNGG